MKLYLLKKEVLKNIAGNIAEFKSGMAILDILSRMSGFIALSHDKLLFSRRVKSQTLVEHTSEFPLTFAYSVDTTTTAGLKLHQAIREWCELEHMLKIEHHLDEADKILYVDKLDKKYFVKTQSKYHHLEELQPKAVLEELRKVEIATEMAKVLEALYVQYQNETLPFKKLMHSNRIKSLLTTLDVNELYIPEKFMKFQVFPTAQDNSGEFN